MPRGYLIPADLDFIAEKQNLDEALELAQKGLALGPGSEFSTASGGGATFESRLRERFSRIGLA